MHTEIWSLPSGQTIRVMARPHTDRTVVYLFEDITPQIAMTRRLRIEAETAIGVLDGFEDAVTVFSENGVMTLANEAYTRLWGTDPFSSPEKVSIEQATEIWFGSCPPSPVWDEVREFVFRRKSTSPWSAEIRMRDGRLLILRLKAIAGGATAIYFRARAGNRGAVRIRA